MSNQKVTNAQVLEALGNITNALSALNARMDALEAKQSTPAPAPASADEELVSYTNAKGETKMISKKLADVYNKRKAQPRTPEQEQLIEQIVANKAKEPERTRVLEKALKVKANSFENTAITLKQALDAGWKPKASDRAGRRAELKAIKAKVRA